MHILNIYICTFLFSELHHPNVVIFMGASLQKPKLFLLLEWCGKGDIQAFLQSKAKISIYLSVRFALDAARGMKYLHRRCNIIQRDFKTSNLLVITIFKFLN